MATELVIRHRCNRCLIAVEHCLIADKLPVADKDAARNAIPLQLAVADIPPAWSRDETGRVWCPQHQPSGIVKANVMPALQSIKGGVKH